MDPGAAAPGRFRSRYLREMNARRENPFHSPPSSTGSHGTVSPTRSSIFSGDSTRRLNAEIDRALAPAKFEVNWDAAHRKWPEFYSAPDRASGAPAAPVPDASISVNLATLDRHAENLRAALAAANIHDSQDSHNDDDDDDDNDDASTQEPTWMGSNRTRAEMQPRVDNDSDASSMLARSPAQLLTGLPSLSGLAGLQSQGARKRSSLSQVQTARSASDPPQIRQARTSLPAAIVSASIPVAAKPKKNTLLTTAAALNRLNPISPAPLLSSPGHNLTVNLTANLTSRSFMMPDISHLGDFISGSLQYQGNNSNGVPVFVKNGRVHDRNIRQEHHADVDGLEIPEDEDKMFVSMDQIREQIISLQEHDDMVQQYADSLEHELEKLRMEVQELKYTRSNDSGLGSVSSDKEHGAHAHHDRLAAENKKLETQVQALQARLNEASTKASASEANTIHLSQEHGRNLKRLEAACAEMNDLVEKLDSTQKRLHSTEQELEVSQQLNMTRNGKSSSSTATTTDVTTLRRELDALKKESKRLAAENRALATELDTLRSDEEMTRKDHERLMAENQSLRATNRNLLKETDDLRAGRRLSTRATSGQEERPPPADAPSLRTNTASSSRELAAVRQEIAALQSDMAKLETERQTLREDNDSLVRHNDKYFTDNKILRKENSSYERTLHELHDDNVRLRDEVDFLKGQLDHCRPMGKEADLTAAIDELEDGMTSAFAVPDVTMSNEVSVGVDVSEQGPPPEPTVQSTTTTRQPPPETTEQSTRNLTAQSDPGTPLPAAKQKEKATLSRAANTSQKVAFSIPESTDGSTPMRPANVGTKRRSVSGSAANQQRKSAKSALPPSEPEVSAQHTQQQSDMARSRRETKATTTAKEPTLTTRDFTHTQLSLRSDRSGTHKLPTAVPITQKRAPSLTTIKDRPEVVQGTTTPCPSLSPSARRVLDTLCEHSCRNCTVCARISSHRLLTHTPAELASGKRQMVIPRPVPVTERDLTSSTVRPANDPGHALAIVLKGLADERDHINMRLTTLQDRYKAADPSVGRRARTALAEQIRQAMASAETKSDQIYHLHDVLIELGRQGTAMNEEEVELTVFSITGAHVADWVDQVVG